MPTYFIKKKVKAENIIDAIQKERAGLAETKDVWFDDEDQDIAEVEGFVFCEQYGNNKTRIKT